MASGAEHLEYVLDLMAGVSEVSTRKMMCEYLLYASGKLFGGVYDDRFLVEETEASQGVLSVRETPYEGASPMLLVDTDDSTAVADPVATMLPELPGPKNRRKQVARTPARIALPPRAARRRRAWPRLPATTKQPTRLHLRSEPVTARA